MPRKIEQTKQRGITSLLNLQADDGRFEGQLSSNTYPTCAYGLVQLAAGKCLDDELINWFLDHQNDDGTYGLDASNGSDREATLFAQLILKQAYKHQANSRVASALEKIPDIPLHLWLIKHAYACCGEISWDELLPPRSMIYLIKPMMFLRNFLPSFLSSRLKPPMHIAFPVDLFFSSEFSKLFIAEQYTLVPLLLIIELSTAKRPDRIEALLTWLKEHRLVDGSWFCVNYITAISILALIEARKYGYGDAAVESMISEGLQWLDRTRNPDGGCREALNLNIWDTSLSVISLMESGISNSDDVIQNACNWLIENQNPDGGWPFSGLQSAKIRSADFCTPTNQHLPITSSLPNDANAKIHTVYPEERRIDFCTPTNHLPSDADDTALSTLALLKSGFAPIHSTVAKGLMWLREHQAKDGSWGTYVPGSSKTDVGCVSITAHAIEAFLAVGNMENEIQRAIRWIQQNISEEGYWNDLWLAQNTYGTACALAALIKAGVRECAEVERGIHWLEQAQNADGGWGEDMHGNPTASTIEQTAWSTYALLLADKQSEAAKRGVEFLLRAQNEVGDWNASCVGIYWEIIGGYIDTIYASVFPLLALNLTTPIP